MKESWIDKYWSFQDKIGNWIDDLRENNPKVALLIVAGLLLFLLIAVVFRWNWALHRTSHEGGSIFSSFFINSLTDNQYRIFLIVIILIAIGAILGMYYLM